MDLSAVTATLLKGYHVVADWVYQHPVRADAIILGVVVGSIVYVSRRKRMKRRRIHRLIWGEIMKRKDLEVLQRMRFEDSILDAAMEMEARGEATEAQIKGWFDFFCTAYNMKGLKPGPRTNEVVKRGIRRRLQMQWALKPANTFGLPKVKVDTSYKPVDEPIPERTGLETSKYV